ncbi:hypothetical protein Vadar_034345 [Vaccinium darrowii]|uniref:Uncharacterized protein n=1 Tax=Vaccinium darrowii TaxID=229202 RepID=A0ACB7X6U7_9ERIC|nr:hypothetical protein Vadar_034345 [Vaccinium darrowii]
MGGQPFSFASRRIESARTMGPPLHAIRSQRAAFLFLDIITLSLLRNLVLRMSVREMLYFDASVAKNEEAIRIDPHFAECNGNMANALKEKGSIDLSIRALEEIREELLQARLELVRTSAKKANQGAWMNKFMKSGSNIEHEAFLSLWLSRFVFPSAAGYDTIGKRVLPIAILLAKGTKIALAPAVLASIYRNLTMLREENQNDVSPLTILAPFQLIQVWIWERFPALGPNPNRMEYGEPRLARWHMVNKLNLKNIEFDVATSGKCFLWRPYIMAGTNPLIHKLYGETENWVLVGPHLVEVMESFARCLRVSELVGLDCMEQYLPHRVSMQFGMDQDVPRKCLLGFVWADDGGCGAVMVVGGSEVMVCVGVMVVGGVEAMLNRLSL